MDNKQLLNTNEPNELHFNLLETFSDSDSEYDDIDADKAKYEIDKYVQSQKTYSNKDVIDANLDQRRKEINLRSEQDLIDLSHLNLSPEHTEQNENAEYAENEDNEEAENEKKNVKLINFSLYGKKINQIFNSEKIIEKDKNEQKDSKFEFLFNKDKVLQHTPTISKRATLTSKAEISTKAGSSINTLMYLHNQKSDKHISGKELENSIIEEEKIQNENNGSGSSDKVASVNLADNPKEDLSKKEEPVLETRKCQSSQMTKKASASHYNISNVMPSLQNAYNYYNNPIQNQYLNYNQINMPLFNLYPTYQQAPYMQMPYMQVPFMQPTSLAYPYTTSYTPIIPKSQVKSNSTKFDIKINEEEKGLSSSESIKYLISLEKSGNFVKYLFSEEGCKDIQRKLSKMTNESAEFLMKITLQHNVLIPMMKDPLANYLFQKAFQLSSTEMKCYIMKMIKQSVLDLGSETFGSHSLQGIITFCYKNKIECEVYIEMILPYIRELSLNQNAVHIIIKLLSLINEFKRRKLNLTLVSIVNELLVDPYGVCVAKELFKTSPSLRGLIKKNIKENYIFLMQNAYGNYFIQHMLEIEIKEEREDLSDIIANNFFILANNKISINVIIKLFEVSTKQEKKKILKKLFVLDKLFLSVKNKSFRQMFSGIIKYIPYELQSMYKEKIFEYKEELKFIYDSLCGKLQH